MFLHMSVCSQGRDGVTHCPCHVGEGGTPWPGPAGGGITWLGYPSRQDQGVLPRQGVSPSSYICAARAVCLWCSRRRTFLVIFNFTSKKSKLVWRTRKNRCMLYYPNIPVKWTGTQQVIMSPTYWWMVITVAKTKIITTLYLLLNRSRKSSSFFDLVWGMPSINPTILSILREINGKRVQPGYKVWLNSFTFARNSTFIKVYSYQQCVIFSVPKYNYKTHRKDCIWSALKFMKMISVFRLWASLYFKHTWTYHSSRTDKVIKLNKICYRYICLLSLVIYKRYFQMSDLKWSQVFGQT